MEIVCFWLYSETRVRERLLGKKEIRVLMFSPSAGWTRLLHYQVSGTHDV